MKNSIHGKTVKLTTSRRTKQTINRWPIWCTAALVDKEYNQGAGAIPGSACSFAIIACLRLKARVIAFDDASKWYNFFEDHGGDEINPTQINAMETVRYLLEKKGQADPDWFNLSEKIINQVTRRWSVTSLETTVMLALVNRMLTKRRITAILHVMVPF